jgi:exopolysaccharide/PEP-CTERM locus tyrosine autokinase
MGRLDHAVEQALRSRRGETPVAERPDAGRPAAATSGAKIAVAPDETRVKRPIPPQGTAPEVLPQGVITREKNPVAAEEYARLKGHILRAAAKDGRKRLLLVTSTGKEEGKSLTALNLAVSIAQSYDNTALLIDADLRDPSLHRYLEVEPKAGFFQYLRGEAAFEEVLVRTGIGRLDFIPAGGVADDPVELLSSGHARAALEEIFARYPERFIVIDSPPVLPFADTQALAHAVGGVVYVIRQGHMGVEQVRKGLEALQGIEVLGLVFNAAEGSLNKKGYGYGYGKYGY